MPGTHADRELVTEIRLAVLFRHARLNILLSAFGGRPFDRYRQLIHHGLLIGPVVQDALANDAGIDDLPLAGVFSTSTFSTTTSVLVCGA